MEISQRAVLIQVASNPDVALAQARLVRADFQVMNVRPCHSGPEEGMVNPPGTVDGSAKRHHHDTPDPDLGEALAVARALQGVVDGLWAQVKAVQPAVETPLERITRKAAERADEDVAIAYQEGHRDALESVRSAIITHYHLEDIYRPEDEDPAPVFSEPQSWARSAYPDLFPDPPAPVGFIARRLAEWRSR